MSQTINDKIISELLTIEAYAEQLREKCYSARKTLESVNSPASKGKRSKKQISQAVLQVLNNRQKTILKGSHEK